MRVKTKQKAPESGKTKREAKLTWSNKCRNDKKFIFLFKHLSQLVKIFSSSSSKQKISFPHFRFLLCGFLCLFCFVFTFLPFFVVSSIVCLQMGDEKTKSKRMKENEKLKKSQKIEKRKERKGKKVGGKKGKKDVCEWLPFLESRHCDSFQFGLFLPCCYFFVVLLTVLDGFAFKLQMITQL